MCYTSQLVTQGPLTTGMLQLWVNTLNFWGANYVQKGWNTDSMHLQKRWYSWTKQRFIKAALSKSLEIGFNVLTTAFCFTVLPTNMLQSCNPRRQIQVWKLFLFVVEVCVYRHIYIYQKIQVCTIDILVPYIYSEKENVQKFNIYNMFIRLGSLWWTLWWFPSVVSWIETRGATDHGGHGENSTINFGWDVDQCGWQSAVWVACADFLVYLIFISFCL